MEGVENREMPERGGVLVEAKGVVEKAIKSSCVEGGKPIVSGFKVRLWRYSAAWFSNISIIQPSWDCCMKSA